MAWFRKAAPAEPEAAPAQPEATEAGRRKVGPTPSRRAAEQARMNRLHPNLTPKQQRAADRAAEDERRATAMDRAEASPERSLLRDYIDNRFHIGEIIMPLMLLLIMSIFFTQVVPEIMLYANIAIWVLFALLILDVVVTWQGFKRVLRDRLPNSSRRGLLAYTINRCLQIRRFRRPAPRIKRGEGY